MPSADLPSELERALRLCEAGEFARAEHIYRNLTERHDDTPDAWNMLAVVLYQQGRLEQAAEAASRATQLRPRIAPYWLVRGNIELAQKRFGDARSSFGRAVRIDPRFAEAHYRLALAHHGDYRFADAVRAYREALRLAPDVAEIYWQLAEALLSLGQVDDAMRAYQQAFLRDPAQTLDRRGCFERLARLRFDALPASWHAELERFCERDDVDSRPYSAAGIRALKTKTAFSEVLRRAAERDDLTFDSDLAPVVRDGLFLALLRNGLMADAEFERLLTRLRAWLLLDAHARARTPPAFLCALALQAFNNEYVWAQTERETTAIAALAREIDKRLDADDRVTDADLKSVLILSCYQRADRAGIERILERAEHVPFLALLLKRSVFDARSEQLLRSDIASIGGRTDAVSRQVREMYEENPYPRWFALDREAPLPLPQWVAHELPQALAVDAPATPRILVAGCGTGRDALWLASNIAGAQVLAIDLSLSSLAYARRMAEAMGMTNIRFCQADILELSSLDERFDMISSTGVLHHMREPARGLRVLTGLLRPGGLMRLGFYSARARASVNAGRAVIAQAGIPATTSGIRELRQLVLASGPDSPLRALAHSHEFYSMSMCRDLLFHVQEHQYTLPQIGAMLDALGLTFLGPTELPHEAMARYTSLFPADRGMADVANWDAYEERYPDTFSRMFVFWCRLPAI